MSKMIYKLAEFEGPLDLLLQLISKHKLNIHDIKIAELLEQYMKQMEIMKENNINITSEFLEMAARLIYIKTVSLLPKNEEAEKLKEELSGQLIEYRECKKIASVLFKNLNLDFISRLPLELPQAATYSRMHTVTELLKAYENVLGKDEMKLPPKIEDFSAIISKKIVSVFSKVIFILRKLYKDTPIDYGTLFPNENSKSDSVATFLALLELIKNKKITISDDNSLVSLVRKRR
ncbi:MAG: segregation/condensation protein A [Clostridia bacterium]|nr:segregation/condensation protein A [Clostridia bacterium]